ncbi:MAG: hypothetical protein MAG453_00592 [Calditrichaeota bacterium]|nr:hypothetical protein [Calditrichota bacterium]
MALTRPRRPLFPLIISAVILPGALAAQMIELDPLPELRGTPPSPEVGRVIAVDFHPEGGVVLLENANLRLLQYDRAGRFVTEAGGFGFEQGGLRGAKDITAAGFEIWIADPFAGFIARYDAWLAPLDPWTGARQRGSEVPFERPVSVARAGSGDVVVLESDRAEALLIDPQGRLVERIGAFGELPEGFIEPRRVEISRSGTIAVADPGRGAVHLFDRFGSPRGHRPWTGGGEGPTSIAWMGDSLWVGGAGRVVLLDERGRTVLSLARDSAGGPVRDLACDGSRLAVAAGSTVRRFRIVRLPGQE